MSVSGSLSPEEIAIAEEKNEFCTGNMARRRLLPAINLPTLQRLQQQDPAHGIKDCLCSANFNLKVGNSLDESTKRSTKQTEKGMKN